jgi:hypothetical protein
MSWSVRATPMLRGFIIGTETVERELGSGRISYNSSVLMRNSLIAYIAKWRPLHYLDIVS